MDESKESGSPRSVDRFGFYGDTPMAAPALTKSEEKVEARRSKKWARMLQDWERLVLKQPNVLKRRVRKGIPNSLRGIAWFRLSGAEELMRKNPGVYEALLLLPSSAYDPEICRDLARTFPDHAFFNDSDGEGQRALFNVLHAYAVFDPSVGYCQGMGFVVGLMLTYMSEEAAFWTTVALMTRYTMAGLFQPGLPRFKVCVYQFEKLLEKHSKRVLNHFKEQFVDTSMYASQWFITIFLHSFPFDIVVRIWDIFLAEGWKIVFRVALALLKLSENELLSGGLDKILSVFKSLPMRVSAKELIRTALAVPIKTSELDSLAHEYRREALMSRSGTSRGPSSLGSPGAVSLEKAQTRGPSPMEVDPSGLLVTSFPRRQQLLESDDFAAEEKRTVTSVVSATEEVKEAAAGGGEHFKLVAVSTMEGMATVDTTTPTAVAAVAAVAATSLGDVSTNGNPSSGNPSNGSGGSSSSPLRVTAHEPPMEHSPVRQPPPSPLPFHVVHHTPLESEHSNSYSPASPSTGSNPLSSESVGTPRTPGKHKKHRKRKLKVKKLKSSPPSYDVR